LILPILCSKEESEKETKEKIWKIEKSEKRRYLRARWGYKENPPPCGR
jgi:hypothetical protein